MYLFGFHVLDQGGLSTVIETYHNNSSFSLLHTQRICNHFKQSHLEKKNTPSKIIQWKTVFLFPFSIGNTSWWTQESLIKFFVWKLKNFPSNTRFWVLILTWYYGIIYGRRKKELKKRKFSPQNSRISRFFKFQAWGFRVSGFQAFSQTHLQKHELWSSTLNHDLSSGVNTHLTLITLVSEVISTMCVVWRQIFFGYKWWFPIW